MKIQPEQVERWINLGFTILGGVPGAVIGIVNLIQQFAPTDVKQKWTEDRVRTYLDKYNAEQADIKDEFDERRTPEEPEEPEEPDTDE